MEKFKQFWKSYRMVVFVVLTLSGAGAPLATSILATGDAVAEIEAEPVGV